MRASSAVIAASLGAAAAVALASCGAQDGASAAGTAVAAAAPAAGAANPVVDTSASSRAGLPCPPSQADTPALSDGLPNLALPCLGPGSDVTLSGLRGTPVVLNVWASWCPPCRAEMPLLVDLADDAPDSLRVLGLNVLDDRQAATDYAASVPLASVYDPLGATRAELRWSGPPVTYLVAADGRIVHRIVGQIPDAATLRTAVEQYLGVEVPDA